jgi:hypothetical protein
MAFFGRDNHEDLVSSCLGIHGFNTSSGVLEELLRRYEEGMRVKS